MSFYYCKLFPLLGPVLMVHLAAGHLTYHLGIGAHSVQAWSYTSCLSSLASYRQLDKLQPQKTGGIAAWKTSSDDILLAKSLPF